MEMNNNDMLYTWIDDSYTVHTDMRGKSGGTMSMGQRAMN